MIGACNCRNTAIGDESQNYLVPGEPVSRHRDGKSHQLLQAEVNWIYPQANAIEES